MRSRSLSINSVLSNKSYIFLLISQGIITLGDNFHLIATTVLLMKITGSGLAAGFGLLSAPIPSILLSLFAGSLGDRLPQKYMLIFLNIMRGCIVALFIYIDNIWIIYFLLLLLSTINALYSPPYKKLIKNILHDKYIITANSLASGMVGFFYLMGPALAGSLIVMWGSDTVFIISSLLFGLAAIILIPIRNHFSNIASYRNRPKPTYSSIHIEIKEGFKYYNNTYSLRKTVKVAAIASFGIASANLAFYSLAFDVLNVTNKMWSLMLSVFYGTSLIAMFISIYLNRRIGKENFLLLYSALIFVGIGWLAHGLSHNMIIIMAALLLEGTSTAVFSNILTTQLQMLSRSSYAARIMGINDILCSVGKLLGIVTTYAILQYHLPEVIFRINSILLFIYIAYKFITYRFTWTNRYPINKY